jgi:hypothetical protein
MNMDWFRENILCFEWAADVFNKILSGESEMIQKRWRHHGGLENVFVSDGEKA